MDIENRESYKNLKKWLDEQRRLKTNGAIITFPGCGLTFRINKYLEINKDVALIVKEGEDLKDFNILAISFVGNELVLKIIDDYLRMASSNQTIIVVIDNSSLLDSDKFKNSLLSTRIYEYYWHGVFNRLETLDLITELDKEVKSIDEISKLSGGIARLIKFLCLKGDNRNINELIKDIVFQSICRPMIEVTKNSSIDYLERLGVARNGKIVSVLLNKILGEIWFNVDIKVDRDLSLVENGQRGKKLARVEKEILLKMIENNGYLSKEKVAEIKWGSENFADFSDQAINKTMRRLAAKMKIYTIETIWKTGFKLVKK